MLPRPDVCYCQTGWLMWIAVSDEETVLYLQLLLVLASVVILKSEFRGTHDHMLLSQIRDPLKLEGQATHTYIPEEQGPTLTFQRNRPPQLHSR
jgi:hypothetical protein